MSDIDSNLQASAAIKVTAVILIIVTVISLLTMIKSLCNLKYKPAQLLLIVIYLMPVMIGWICWIQLQDTSKMHYVHFTLTLIKASCLACFFSYIEKMLGITNNGSENVFCIDTLYSNLASDKDQKRILCCKTPKINSVDSAKSYLMRIKVLVYQLCFVFTACAVVGIVYAVANDDLKMVKSTGTEVFLILSGATSCSSLLALCALLNFGYYTHSLPSLSHLNILHKFIIIKLGLIFTEFQPIIIYLLSLLNFIASTEKFSYEEITLYTNSLLVVSEMIILSFLIIEVFPLSDYDHLSISKKNLLEKTKDN